MQLDRLIVADLETTGVNHQKGEIIEACVQLYDFPNRKLLSTITERFKPKGNIPEKASAVNGIYAKDVAHCINFENYIPAIRAVFRQAELAVYHNAGFETKWLAGHAGIETPSYCTMLNGRWACHDGKIPRLEELCFALGVEFDPEKAHAAQYDVEKTAACLFAGIDSGDFVLEV